MVAFATWRYTSDGSGSSGSGSGYDIGSSGGVKTSNSSGGMKITSSSGGSDSAVTNSLRALRSGEAQLTGKCVCSRGWVCVSVSVWWW